MSQYFLGVDVGSSKTHACIADERGQVVGFGSGGAGNHETVGYEGMKRALTQATEAALSNARLEIGDIAAAGLGIAGFDWHTERPQMLETIGVLGLDAPVEIVNDAMLGVIAGSAEGWGLAIVSGTGCNCRGQSRDGKREGMVTGAGEHMGEGTGAGELVRNAVRAVAHSWTRRGPPTRLAEVLVERAGALDVEDLLEAIVNERYEFRASAAPLVFQIAAEGDVVAQGLVERAGCELGELAKAVIRQLDFQHEEFDIVFVGGMFNAGESLIRPLRETVLALAPGARFVKLAAPPVAGAVLLAMEQVDLASNGNVRERLNVTIQDGGKLRVTHGT